MQKNIGIIVKYTNQTVWNALAQHISLIKNAGYETIIFISKKANNKVIDSSNSPYIVVYKSNMDLIKKLNQQKNLWSLWSPDIITTLHLIIQRFFYHRQIVTWIQGTLPEESYMRYHSRFRRWILNLIEALSFKISNKFVFVSESMVDFYQHQHPFGKKPHIVVPCLSEFSLFNNQINKIPNSYVYIGGLSEWQCFKETVSIYKKIRTVDSVFHIITLDTQKAIHIINDIIPDANDIKIYSITERNKIPYILSQFERGFLIRKESPVNYVASPIKFLEYLSCNVDVIITKAIPSYANIVEKYQIGTVVDIHSPEIILIPYSGRAKQVYSHLFSKQEFINRYQQLLR